jgi:hypothetical protein
LISKKYKNINLGITIYFFVILFISFADSFGVLTFLRHIEVFAFPLALILGLRTKQYNLNKLSFIFFTTLFYTLLSIYNGNSLIVIMLSILGIKYVFFEPFFYKKYEFQKFFYQYINIVGFLCIPLSLVQRVISENHTGDDVVGVFGQGGSGVLTLFLIALCFARMLTSKNKMDIFYSFILLVPIFINETKIVYVIVASYLLFIFLLDNKIKIINKLYLSLFSFVALYFIDYYLDTVYGQGLRSIDQDFLDDYLYKEWEYDVGRVLKYQIYFNYICNLSLMENVFGFGIGSSLIANTTGISGIVAENLAYYRIFEGTKIGAFRLYSDFGLLGLTLIVSYFFYILKKSFKADKCFNYYFKVFMTINFIIGIFYTDFIYSYLYMGITLAAVSIRFEYEDINSQ